MEMTRKKPCQTHYLHQPKDFLVPTLPRGNAYGSITTHKAAMGSHAGAWEPEIIFMSFMVIKTSYKLDQGSTIDIVRHQHPLSPICFKA